MRQEIGKCYYSIENGRLTVGNELFQYTVSGGTEGAKITNVTTEITDVSGLTKPFLEVTAEIDGEQRKYCVWEDLPVVRMPEYREDALMKLQGEHWTVRSVKLSAFTDENDTLTGESFASLFARKLYMDQIGEIFYLEDCETGNAMVIICEMADYHTATLSIRDGVVKVQNDGVGLALGFCKVGECEALGRAYYQHMCLQKELVTMSNTWGDRNGDSRVCQDFVMREIDMAKKIGVDIVQIDDGWQIGKMSNQRDKEGYAIFYEGFWEPDEERFPNGMKYVTDYAREKGIRVGLWFAPDFHNNFALLERDMGVLYKAYHEWGIRFFKLDFVYLRNAKDQEKFIRLLQTIYTWGDDVAVQIDVTRNNRLNYLGGIPYGTAFVENRYTLSGNSFPHRVLRNLWMISQYIPASKFQFEVVNPDLNREIYNEKDPFQPCLYDMDYLFASVMLANPLFWMEMQFLSAERREQLKNIMEVWKEHRQELADADVKPIGERPGGRSFTGFYISTKNREKYLLLFREVTETSIGKFKIPVQKCEFEILASNTQVEAEWSGDTVSVKFDKPRAYAFIKLLS